MHNIIKKHVITSTSAVHKYETFSSPLNGKKIRNYAYYPFGEGIIEDEVQKLTEAIQYEIEVKQKIPTFDTKDIRNEILKNRNIIISENSISLGICFPKENADEKLKSILDGFSLFYVDEPILCSNGFVFDRSRYAIWLTQSTQCPCGFHQIESMNIDSYPISKKTITQSKIYLVRYDRETLEWIDNWKRIKQSDIDVKELQASIKEIQESHKELKESNKKHFSDIEELKESNKKHFIAIEKLKESTKELEESQKKQDIDLEKIEKQIKFYERISYDQDSDDENKGCFYQLKILFYSIWNSIKSYFWSLNSYLWPINK